MLDEYEAQAVAKSWSVNFSTILRTEITSSFAECTLQLLCCYAGQFMMKSSASCRFYSLGNYTQ